MSIETVENLKESHWGGGAPPMKASYGKTMMWYFLISDTFTFVAFLVSYATVRMVNAESWPKASKVFSSIPIPGFEKFHELPLVFVSIMTFILPSLGVDNFDGWRTHDNKTKPFRYSH